MRVKIFCLISLIFCPWVENTLSYLKQGTHELFSTPYNRHETFFIMVRNILLGILTSAYLEFGICPCYFNLSVAYALFVLIHQEHMLLLFQFLMEICPCYFHSSGAYALFALKLYMPMSANRLYRVECIEKDSFKD